MAISPRGVVRSTSCLVLLWGFRGRRIEWRIGAIYSIGMRDKNNARRVILLDWPQSKVFLVILWDQCKKYIIDDRPTSDRRPTDDRPLNFENFKWPYLREGSSDSLRVCSRVGFSKSADRMALFPVGPNSIGIYVGLRENNARGVIRLVTIWSISCWLKCWKG